MIEVIDNRDKRNCKFGSIAVGTPFTIEDGGFYIKSAISVDGNSMLVGLNIETGRQREFGANDEVEVVDMTVEVS